MTSQDVAQLVQVAQHLIAEAQALKNNAVSKVEVETSIQAHIQAWEGKITKEVAQSMEGIVGSLAKALYAEIQSKMQGEIDALKGGVTTLEQRDVAMQGAISSVMMRTQQLGEAITAPAPAGTDK